MKKILNKHLSMISAFINSNDKVIDIGCDHGLLGIFLVKEKNVSRMISSDINKGPLKKAKENIIKYNLDNKIELRLGNGLEAVSDDIDTIVISGMGGITITNILSDIRNYNNIKKLIISPNSDYELTRRFISQLGFKLEKEEMIIEKNKYYLISEYLIGKEKINYFFGKLDLSNKIVKSYYNDLYNKNKLILKRLSWIKRLTKLSLIKENILIKKRNQKKY